MDHAYIEEHGLIDLYHRGQLPPEEEAGFEEHFMGCAACQERLQMARGFQRGLKAAVAEEVTKAGLLTWLLRRRWVALAALILAAVLPLLGYLAGSRDAAPIETEANWRQLFEKEQRSADDLRRQLEESERQRLAQAEPAPAPSPSPLVNTPVFLLTAVRGEDEATSVKVEDGYFSLAVDAGDDPRFESYRVTIADAQGKRMFREAGLKPNALEALLLTFPAGFFKPGEYRLALEGIEPGGNAAELGGYSFRIVG
ncbi:MAG TPA: zf-HC2 domain-containing protein [Thermoanaerobaculia bacterium]